MRTLHARLAVTSAKAERELGATFRPLAETLRDVVKWHRQNPLPLRPITAAVTMPAASSE